MTARSAVAAGNRDTARAAARVLEHGGNAFDAVLAGMTAACVAEPVLCSFGGGGFLLAQPVDQKPRVIDFFTQTPGHRSTGNLDFYEIKADFGTAVQPFHIGRAAAAVPGMVAGLFEIHRTLGRMPLADTLAPALEIAREGVILDPLQAHILEVVSPIMTATERARGIYTKPNGSLVTSGDHFWLPGFEVLLELLIEEGDRAFYEGEIAQSIADLCEPGGLITKEDLRAYRPVTRAPREVTYRGAKILLNDLPSSGGPLIAYTLGLLERLGQALDPGHPDFFPLLARAQALTGDARRESGFALSVTPESEERLFNDQMIETHVRALKTGGTTHISVTDSEGSMAAVSLSNGEGNGHVIPGTGVMLNNMLGEEDLNPEGFFNWTPNTRVSSMMAPCIASLSDGRRMALGSGGSNRIRSAILQVLVQMIDGIADARHAVDASRVHMEQGTLSIEGGHEEASLEALREAYPNAETWPGHSFFFGGVHVAGRDDQGHAFAAGDPRRGGEAILIP